MSSATLSTYGASLDAEGVARVLRHVFRTNALAASRGEHGVPACIWGAHGLGKTAIVEQIAREEGWRFAYAAPAQFEEMGDLHGLPRHEVVEGRAVTTSAPPAWVPHEPGPGILLLDDLNRADDRILRGLMQLLQTGRMWSWGLPAGWHIAATANPEGGDYSVTPMDDAMLTRLLHVTLVFDARAWASWASRAGVDDRGIAFVLTYPEVVTGRRTTPRSLVQFFDQLRGVGDLRAELDLVTILGRSTLDDTTVAAFTSFVTDGLEKLVTPADVLDAPRTAPMLEKIAALATGEAGERRMDRISVVCTRLALALTHPSYVPGKRHAENLVGFLTSSSLPNDLRVALHRDLVARGGEPVREMMRDARLAKLVLAEM